MKIQDKLGFIYLDFRVKDNQKILEKAQQYHNSEDKITLNKDVEGRCKLLFGLSREELINLDINRGKTNFAPEIMNQYGFSFIYGDHQDSSHKNITVWNGHVYKVDKTGRYEYKSTNLTTKKLRTLIEQKYIDPYYYYDNQSPNTLQLLLFGEEIQQKYPHLKVYYEGTFWLSDKEFHDTSDWINGMHIEDTTTKAGIPTQLISKIKRGKPTEIQLHRPEYKKTVTVLRAWWD